MAIDSYALPGYMFTLVMLALLAIVFTTGSQFTRSQLDRMSLAFGVAHKPYTPPSKPKGKKDKFQLLMARAKYAGTGVVGLSGKINGTVFLSNGVVRVWKKPNNVRNAFTQLVRGTFSGVSTGWKLLTASQVSGWITAAPLFFSKAVFGTKYALKGNALFQRVNNTLLSIGTAPTSDAPGIATPGYVLTAVAATASVGGTSFDINCTEFTGLNALPADGYMKVYATRQVDIGQSSFGPSRYRLIGFFPPTTATNPLDVYADYIARFGTLVEGQRIGFAIATITWDGSAFHESGRFYGDVVVAA